MRRSAGGAGRSPAPCVDELDIADEAITAAMHGLNEARLPRIIVERGANLAHRDLEHGVADEHARPDGVEEIVLRHQATPMLGEMAEQRERLGRQRHLLGAAPDALVGTVEAEPIATRARGDGRGARAARARAAERDERGGATENVRWP